MTADCVERFRGFLRFLWMDNTEEEALQQWRQRVADFPDEAERDLACLDAIAADPPADLVEMLNHDGWIILSHQPDPASMIDYSREEYLDWLRGMTARFRTAYEQAT